MSAVVEDVLTAMSSDSGLIDGEITLDTVAHVDHLARIRAGEAMQVRAV